MLGRAAGDTDPGTLAQSEENTNEDPCEAEQHKTKPDMWCWSSPAPTTKAHRGAIHSERCRHESRGGAETRPVC